VAIVECTEWRRAGRLRGETGVLARTVKKRWLTAWRWLLSLTVDWTVVVILSQRLSSQRGTGRTFYTPGVLVRSVGEDGKATTIDSRLDKKFNSTVVKGWRIISWYPYALICMDLYDSCTAYVRQMRSGVSSQSVLMGLFTWESRVSQTRSCRNELFTDIRLA
jgi:hypothetical protein